jgi:hypothetical protein
VLGDSVDTLNANVERINRLLFTFLDYAAIGRRAVTFAGVASRLILGAALALQVAIAAAAPEIPLAWRALACVVALASLMRPWWRPRRWPQRSRRPHRCS